MTPQEYKKRKNKKALITLSAILISAIIIVGVIALYTWLVIESSTSFGYKEGFKAGKEQGVKAGYKLRQAEEALQLAKDLDEIDSIANTLRKHEKAIN